jgi:FkbH-like protein
MQPSAVRSSPSAPELFKDIAKLRSSGRNDEALARIRDALKRGSLEPEKVDKAGRILRKEIDAAGERATPLRIQVLGQCTTSWLINTLTAVAWGRGVMALVDEGGYDNVLQDLERLAASSGPRPDVVVLLPWSKRLLSDLGADAGSRHLASELEFWKEAWDIASGRLGCRILQIGYDYVTPGASGYAAAGKAGGSLAMIREANSSLRANLPPDAYFLDLSVISGELGRASFYDPRRYHWTKQPFSEVGILELSNHLWAGIRALTTGPKKVLVLDLDNTLWGGVVGETGHLGIGIGESPDGEAFLAFQKHLKDLTRNGILLAIASKNNEADAVEPFQSNADMILKLDDIAAFEACWEPKGTTIRRIAKALNLGLDSFVFFDDNPAEREQVRQALPEVEVVDVPEDPAGYVRALESGLWFETVGLTDADKVRVEQYAFERQRRALEVKSGSLDEYLRSLEMVAEHREIDDADLQRVVQLLAKTNQFNLTTRRHTREDVLSLLRKTNSIGFTIRVRDRFGDHGLIGTMIAVPEADSPQAMRIDTWLMSCRVIGRTVEQFSFRTMVECARKLGYRRVLGEYVPTPKNLLVKGLYESLGFRPLNGFDDASFLYELDLDSYELPPTFVCTTQSVLEGR